MQHMLAECRKVVGLLQRRHDASDGIHQLPAVGFGFRCSHPTQHLRRMRRRTIVDIDDLRGRNRAGETQTKEK